MVGNRWRKYEWFASGVGRELDRSILSVNAIFLYKFLHGEWISDVVLDFFLSRLLNCFVCLFSLRVERFQFSTLHLKLYVKSYLQRIQKINKSINHVIE